MKSSEKNIETKPVDKKAALASCRVLLFALYAIAVFAAIALTLVNKIFMADNYLYENGTPSALLLVFALFAVILSFVLAFTVGKVIKGKDESVLGKANLARKIIATLFILAFVAAFLGYLSHGAFDIGYGNPAVNSTGLADRFESVKFIYKLMIVLTPLAGFYFTSRKTNPLLGAVTIAWLLSYILRLYFDTSDWVMSPRKLSVTFAFCIITLFILYEIRFAFGRGSIRKYMFFGAFGGLSCFVSGFSGIFCSLLGVFPSIFELPYYIIVLLFGIYAFYRVHIIVFDGEKESENKTAEKSEENAEITEESEETVTEE